MRARGLLGLLAAALFGIIALPAAPAAANNIHTLGFTSAIDVKDDDVGDDDWCYAMPANKTITLDHGHYRKIGISQDVSCDEVGITVAVSGELFPDERMCNIVVDVYLYEDSASSSNTHFDLDGRTQWKGGMNWCIGIGGRLTWDSIRVDNTAEDAPDHGWVRNLVIKHGAY